MKSIDPNSHELFSCIVDFSQQLSKRSSQQGHAASEEVITTDFPQLINGKSLSDFVQQTVDDVKADPLSSLSMRVAVAKAMISANVGSSDDAASLVLDSKLNVRGVTVETCQDALAFMASLDKKEQMMQLILSKFPFAKEQELSRVWNH